MSEFEKDTPANPEAVSKDSEATEPKAETTIATGSGTMPGFLTREEYEQVGDDPEPLPKDFQVIDGGANEAGCPVQTATDSAAPVEASDAAAPSAAETEDVKEPAPTGAAAAANAVGLFFSEGVASVREVNAARRAHAEAREALEQLDRALEEQTSQLEHRRDIAARFDAIVAEETARREQAATAKTAAETELSKLERQGDDLKAQLETMKEADAATEKRLRSALEAAEAKEESARESGSRLQRRLDDARRNLEAAQSEHTDGAAAQQHTIESIKAHIAALNAELAEVQRNPSANSAQYSVRSAELQGEISDAAEELRLAQEDLPRVTAETSAAIATAQAAVAEAEKPIETARKAYDAATAEASRARDAHDAAKNDAETRQKELRRRISDISQAVKEQQRAAEKAQEEADAAQASLDEANDIHAHPEATDALAQTIAGNRAERDKRATAVDKLAAVEQDVRERTRESRVKFIGIITVVVALVVIAVILQFVMPR